MSNPARGSSGVATSGDTASVPQLFDSPHPTNHECRRCRNGLFWPEGAQRCWSHTDAAARALLADLDRRAGRLGVPASKRDEYRSALHAKRWPYGPNLYVEMRQAMVEWAERQGLTLDPRAPYCLSWIRAGRCRHQGDHDYRRWMDHTTMWRRNGQPALLLGQPYGLSDRDTTELVELAGDPLLRVDLDPANGWYGSGTCPVVIWRRPEAPKIERPPVADPWCLHHGVPDPAHPNGCNVCARLIAKGRRQRRPWTGPTGHDGVDCLHCDVCDLCRGSGRVCRWCARCDEHEDEQSIAECVYGWEELDMPVIDPATGLWHRPAIAIFGHSTYDKTTGCWSEPDIDPSLLADLREAEALRLEEMGAWT